MLQAPARESCVGLALFGHAATALGELGFVLGADAVGAGRALLLGALRLTLALVGAALLRPASVGPLSLPVRTR